MVIEEGSFQLQVLKISPSDLSIREMRIPVIKVMPRQEDPCWKVASSNPNTSKGFFLTKTMLKSASTKALQWYVYIRQKSDKCKFHDAYIFSCVHVTRISMKICKNDWYNLSNLTKIGSFCKSLTKRVQTPQTS